MRSSAALEVERPLYNINEAESGEPFLWENWSRVIFPGFYDTWIGVTDWLQERIESDQEYARFNDVDTEGLLLSWDDVDKRIEKCPNFYYAYEALVSEKYTEMLWEQLCGAGYDNIITSMKFDHLWSPKEYNWYTDCLDLVLTCDFEALEAWIQDNLQDFDKYLYDHWTSCDGFISYTPNNYEDLKDSLKYRETCIEYFLWKFMVNDSDSSDDVFYDSIFYKMHEWLLDLCIEDVMCVAEEKGACV